MNSIRPEDASLAEEIAARSGSVILSPNLSAVEQWARVVSTLRGLGYVVRKDDDDEASSGPDFGMVYRRVEPKIREVMKRMAPPGTEVTPALITKVQAEIVRLLAVELRAAGLGETSANAIAGLMSAAIHLKGRHA